MKMMESELSVLSVLAEKSVFVCSVLLMMVNNREREVLFLMHLWMKREKKEYSEERRAALLRVMGEFQKKKEEASAEMEAKETWMGVKE